MLQSERLYRRRWHVRVLCRAVDECLVVRHVCHLRDLMVHLEENGHASYIVNVGVIFAPLLGSCPDDGITSLLRAIPAVERPHDPCNGLVRQELPDTIRGDDDELVLRL